jgi:ABC-type transport system substrate-binding protein
MSSVQQGKSAIVARSGNSAPTVNPRVPAPADAEQQAVELDHAKRAAILTKMQQIVYERVITTHLWQLAFLNGVGPRVGESSFGRIPGFAYTAPYEDVTLKSS